MTSKSAPAASIARILNTRVLAKRLMATSAMTFAGVLAMASSAYAVGEYETPKFDTAPGAGMNVASNGTATVTGYDTNYLTVTTGTPGTPGDNRTVIDWKTFNIGEQATTEFKQQGDKSVTINRVNGSNDPSKIFGTLKSSVNGQSGRGTLIILDPNGVFFGSGATIDVGGIHGLYRKAVKY